MARKPGQNVKEETTLPMTNSSAEVRAEKKEKMKVLT